MAKEKRDIEWLVNWALIDNGLARSFGHRAGHVDWMDLGTRIQVGHSDVGGLPGLKHDDALLVCEAMRGLPAEMARGAALVYQHGIAGDRPDWCEEGPGFYRQMTDGRGRPRWIWENPKSRTGRREPMLELVGVRPELCAHDRSLYQLWWVSLQALVVPLNEVMTGHEATGPRAAFAPWDMPKVKRPDGSVVKGFGRNDYGRSWQAEVERGGE